MPDQAEAAVITLRTETVYNFGAGPAMLPVEVMRQAQAEFLNWQGSGISAMETSHRSDAFMALAERAEADLRELLLIPDNYRVLFLQGGASSQFAMVPMNILRGRGSADYVHTGYWSGRALNEARKFCRVNICASGEAGGFRSIPDPAGWDLDLQAAYVYYTANETIQGVEFHFIPETGDVALVSDMTSTLLSRPLDVSRFGVIFAGAQKNIGPAGLVMVIVRDDLIGRAGEAVPSLQDYALQARERSMINTPPTFSWYIAALVLQWIKRQGGLPVMEARARRKSEKLYRVIDGSGFYINTVDVSCRSRMNVTFRLADEALNPLFLSEAKANGLIALAGHRIAGGMRASLYNAMPEEGVDRLVSFMGDFERRHG